MGRLIESRETTYIEIDQVEYLREHNENDEYILLECNMDVNAVNHYYRVDILIVKRKSDERCFKFDGDYKSTIDYGKSFMFIQVYPRQDLRMVYE